MASAKDGGNAYRNTTDKKKHSAVAGLFAIGLVLLGANMPQRFCAGSGVMVEKESRTTCGRAQYDRFPRNDHHESHVLHKTHIGNNDQWDESPTINLALSDHHRGDLM